MKNKNFCLIMDMGALLLLFFSGCTTTTSVTTPLFYSNNSNYEFIILGEVTYRSSISNGFQELLKAARTKYPSCDYVIDVMIDSRIETTSPVFPFSLFLKSETSTSYTMRGTAIRYIRDNLVTFPSNFIGTWKRDNFDNTLTFTSNSIQSSTQANPVGLIDASVDLFTLAYTDNDRTFTITINFVNNYIEISGGTGSGQNNWNGVWRKQ